METEEYVKVTGYVFLYDLEEDLQVVTVIRLEDELSRLVLTPWDNADPEEVFLGGLIISIHVILVLLVAFILYLGQTEISFSPFRIKITEWYKPLGIIIMIIGFLIYTGGSERKSFKDGWTKAKNEIINGNR